MKVPERSAMMSSSMVELQLTSRSGSIRNATLPRLGLLREECKEVEGLKAERLAWFGRQWHSGERA
jgi:hypothetical protein